ncbi:HNH endonuclease [Mycoplasmopsis hyopharyngis]|uniref:HNH endonuclease n=1 Tax=Mycoplasmopsis hyopharyngis TaxID=29558 RepID=UPI003872FABC
MEILVSESFIKNALNSIKKRDLISLLESVLFEKIYALLINDGILRETISFSNIKWIKDKRAYQGIFISEKNLFVYFSQLLNSNGKPKSRNTFVSQNFNPIQKIAIENNSYICLSLNPLDLGTKVPSFPNTIIKDIRTLSTLGVIINKSINIDNNIFDFKSIDEYINMKNFLKSKNSFNQSTFIKKFDFLNTIAIYANMDGASGIDALNSMRMINKFRDVDNIKNYWFFNIGKKTLSENFIKTINEEYNFEYIDTIKYNKNDFIGLNTKITEKDIENDLRRNQPYFIKNILKKYDTLNPSKCFCCNYMITSNLIASHIYRVADIISDYKNRNISLEKAQEYIISGDNGFMLCPNHDKEFEKGYIYFDPNSKKMVASENLDIETFEFINFRINMNELNRNFITEEFIENVKRHKVRTKN